MDTKEMLNSEQIAPAQADPVQTDAPAEEMNEFTNAESSEISADPAANPEKENSVTELPMDDTAGEEAVSADAYRPDDVSEDGSPHGPLGLFGDTESNDEAPAEKNVPTFAAFHTPDDRKPGELDDYDEDDTPARAASKNDKNDDEEDEEFDEDEEPMTIMGHLNELRRRLCRIVILVILGFVAFYGVAEPLYDFLSAPLKVQLPEGSKLIYTSPAGAFFTYMKVALVASLFGTSPLTFYQIWSFIAPGLYKEEKKAVLPLAFFSSIFFLAGASFCFFMVFPIAFKFFMGFATDTIVPMISVEEYLGFALKLLIAFGVVFEMPLFAYFLSRFGILSPEFMRRQRRYAILLIFIVAAILTPPDVFSQCLMAIPMLLLYEVSIYVSALAYKKKEKPSDPSEEEKEEQA